MASTGTEQGGQIDCKQLDLGVEGLRAARATNKVGTIGARLTLFDVGSKVAKNGEDLGRRPL